MFKLHVQLHIIAQFWYMYIKMSAWNNNITSRLWGINRRVCNGFIPHSLAVMFTVSGWILIYQNWTLQHFDCSEWCFFVICRASPGSPKSSCPSRQTTSAVCWRTTNSCHSSSTSSPCRHAASSHDSTHTKLYSCCTCNASLWSSNASCPTRHASSR